MRCPFCGAPIVLNAVGSKQRKNADGPKKKFTAGCIFAGVGIALALLSGVFKRILLSLMQHASGLTGLTAANIIIAYRAVSVAAEAIGLLLLISVWKKARRRSGEENTGPDRTDAAKCP